MAVFCIVAPLSLIDLMMEAMQTSETLVNLHQSTRGYKPEDSHLHDERCKHAFEPHLKTFMKAEWG
jgi:hypothetical protein